MLCPEMRACVTLVEKVGDGAVPLGPVRHIGFLKDLANAIDKLGVSMRPNLFAQQVVLIVRKGAASG